jgi:20S proteasome alpha/beta subunit
MTIAAGFVCTDGIVIAADTQFSSNVLKISRTKIQSSENKTCVIAVSGADVLMDKAVEGVLSSIAPEMGRDEISHEIEQTLRELYVDYIDPAGQPDFDIGLLVAVNASDGAALFQHNRWAVSQVKNYACVGTGAVLGTYVVEQLWSGGSRPCITASIVAVHAVQVAKRYDPWCGKETELFVLPTNGTAYQQTARNITRFEQFFDSVETVLHPLLLAIPDPAVSNEAVDERLKRFEEGVRATRPLHLDIFAQLTGVVSMSAIGQLVVSEPPTPSGRPQSPAGPAVPPDLEGPTHEE